MVTSTEDLLALAEESCTLREILDQGDWYLVGSRSTGMADVLSDWDTIVFVPGAARGVNPRPALIDETFAVVRPVRSGDVTLDFHRRWRVAGGIDIDVLGVEEQSEREHNGLAEWAFTLSHAVPLRLTSDVGESYRRALASRFASRAEELAAISYRAFRQSRNEAVSTLARDDIGAQALTSGACVTDAARFWLLAGNQPHPAGKWLLEELDRSPDGAAASATMRSILDMTAVSDVRFDAL